MTLLGLLIFALVFVLILVLAHWVIQKFFPPGYQIYALIIVGAIALIVLLLQFWPSAAQYRIVR